MNSTATIRDPSTPQEPGTQHYFLDDDSVPELGRMRSDRLLEVRSQERVQRRTVEQDVDSSLVAPSLDNPVPQMENQLLDVCRQLDVFTPEQAIEVPKISSPSAQGARRRRNSWWKCLRSYLCLLCVRLWSSTLTFQFLMVVAGSSRLSPRTSFHCFILALTWCRG